MTSAQFPDVALTTLRTVLFTLHGLGVLEEPSLVETHRCGFEQTSSLFDREDLPTECLRCGDTSRLTLVWKTKLTLQVFQGLLETIDLFLQEQKHRIEEMPTLSA